MVATQSPSSQTWAETRGAKWRDQLDPMEAMLAPIDAPLIAALHLSDHLRIAEIGAGGGATTRAIAAAAPGSTIEGFDISPDLIGAAKARVGGVARFTLADVADFRPAERFDRLVSRFGVMFFEAPEHAFANLIQWLLPGGTLAFAVWGPGQDVAFMASVREAVAAVIDLPQPDPDAPGPCRYGDPSRLLALLEAAGFCDCAARTWRGDLQVGGGMAPDAAAEFLLASSSAAAPLADAGAREQARARERLAAVCAANLRDGIVWMPARVEIITATA
ncbi:class I SAM-dependent methyltransferase [Sphingomonas solaris]|uniref:Class I SAM-dependent methyltransferase n=2 Tax=Alterirhizorhabdus solaris TaxID=2529389 RepID=A0A558RAP9_9SPHN|nr:class I SAM-dependent methyltransferase [Sphingomonas solaris]